MPRDSSGNYTLPAGNPVVTGTTITSSWGNTTLNDLSSVLTNSLDRNGNGHMLAPLTVPSGVVGAPSLSFNSDTATGFYLIAAGRLGLSVGGVLQLDMQNGIWSLKSCNLTMTPPPSGNALTINAVANGSGLVVNEATGAAGIVVNSASDRALILVQSTGTSNSYLSICSNGNTPFVSDMLLTQNGSASGHGRLKNFHATGNLILGAGGNDLLTLAPSGNATLQGQAAVSPILQVAAVSGQSAYLSLAGNGSSFSAGDFLIQSPGGAGTVHINNNGTGPIVVAINGTNIIQFIAGGNVQITGALGVNNNAPPSQVTGWGTPTGAAVVANFSGAAATLVNCSNAIAKIITDLKAIGFYAA